MTGNSPSSTGISVWDLPTRLFHWLLVLLVAFLWLTGEVGGITVNIPLPGGERLFLDNMALHMLAGRAVLVLVLFRLGWGLVGSSTARFASFVRGPGAAVAYVKQVARGQLPLTVGHNPAGGLMILALLLFLLVQAGTGLFARDDLFSEGPLAHLVSESASGRLTFVHVVMFKVLLVLVLAHLAAAVYYAIRGKNLVRPMITGRKPASLVPAGAAQSVRLAPAWLAVPVLAAAAVAVWALHLL